MNFMENVLNAVRCLSKPEPCVQSIKSVIHHGVKEFGIGPLSTTFSGFLIVGGSYYCVTGYRDILSGNIKNGLLKGMLGTAATAYGIFDFLTTWGIVVADAQTVYCRKWWYRETGNGPYKIAVQTCNVFNCSIPVTVPHLEYEDSCPFILGSEGFQNVYQMKKAELGCNDRILCGDMTSATFSSLYFNWESFDGK